MTGAGGIGAEGGPALDDAAAAVAALGIGPTDRVLEVGGAANAFPRADVVCDLTFGQTGQRNGAPGVFRNGTTYVEAAAEALPFRDGEFDFVWCTQVLEHVRDPARAAAELSRVARRGFVEVPSRVGEMLNGNPTHRWVVDREGDVLVFRPRTFVEHPFDHLLYGRLFQDPEFKRRADGPLRATLNHQVVFEGRLHVRVEPAPPGATVFDYEDPAQAGRAHYHFARCCLAGGADPAYAMVDAEAAAALLPRSPEAARLAAIYRARFLRFDDARAALAGRDDAASVALRKLIDAAADGDLATLRALPPPGPLAAAAEGVAPASLPLVSVAVPAAAGELGLRDAVEGALTQDYPAVEVVVAAADPAAARAELAPFSGVDRLRIVDAAGLSGGALWNAAFSACRGGVLAAARPDERQLPRHLERLVAALLASGADAAHGDLLRGADGAVEAPELAPYDAGATTLSLSTLVGHQAAFLRTGPCDPGEDGAAQWLARFARCNRALHVPVASVVSRRPRPEGARAVDAARAALRLDPTDLLREIWSLRARLDVLDPRRAAGGGAS